MMAGKKARNNLNEIAAARVASFPFAKDSTVKLKNLQNE
jgi:hypothetical protein